MTASNSVMVTAESSRAGRARTRSSYERAREMRDKMIVREAVWTALEQAKVVRSKSVHDKIPHCHGAEAAAQRLFQLDLWRQARVLKSNPLLFVAY